MEEILPPKASLTCTRSWFSQSKAYPDWIETHWFNHKVDVILPNYSKEETTKLLHKIKSQNFHYYLATTSFSTFVDPIFLDLYVKKGKLYVISTSTPLDDSNVTAALFNGKLHLTVNKDTYEQLGLVGSPSSFCQKGQRYNITIDLLKPSFVPGKKFYERVKWCLEKISDASFLYSFVLDNHPGAIEFPPTTPHKKLPFEYHITTHNNVPSPHVSSAASLPSEDLSPFLYSVHTWSEFLNFGIKPHDLSEEGYPISYSQQNVTAVSWRGLIPPTFIHNLLQCLRDEITESTSFATLSVTGFEDSPVSWGMKEHGFEKSGENAYTFFVLPNDEFWFL
eukprot:Phypoly_transcript_13099.p1 GENE.Phypoly_transcript_13099~~Phypoly_transcript_13099.p1  ORF type:complete len:344 (+),score=62.81 Phypoly_transcript_13099:25-1032(+)